MVIVLCQCDWGIGLETPHYHPNPILGASWNDTDKTQKLHYRWGHPPEVWEEVALSVDWKDVAKVLGELLSAGTMKGHT
jgi:hypothetical protein